MALPFNIVIPDNLPSLPESIRAPKLPRFRRPSRRTLWIILAVGLAVGLLYYAWRSYQKKKKAAGTGTGTITWNVPDEFQVVIPATLTTGAGTGVYINLGVASLLDVVVTVQDGLVYVSNQTDTDPSSTHFYIDGRYVGNTLDRWGPFVQGGIYKISCKSWPADQNYYDTTVTSHIQWIYVDAPMSQPGALPVPSSFVFAGTFCDRHTRMLPTWSAPQGKICPMYRFAESDSLDDLFQHGATHGAHMSGAEGSQLFWTTGQPLDQVHEDGVMSASYEQMEAYADQTTAADFLAIDVETNWSTDFQDATLPKLYRYIQRYKANNPGSKVGFYTNLLVVNKNFNVDGEYKPMSAKFLTQYDSPETAVAPCYRQFADETGTHSLRDICDLYFVDCYIGEAIGLNHQSATVQIYAILHDFRILKKLLPASAVIIGFGWQQTDADARYRLFQRTSTGYAWRIVKESPPAWWAMAAELISFWEGRGFHWWHDAQPASDDPDKVPHFVDGEGWIPDQAGSPAPIGDYPNAYPLFHHYPLMYGKLGEWKFSQIASIVANGTCHDASYSVDGGQSWIQANGEITPLFWAEGELPIVIVAEYNGQKVVLAGNPTGFANKSVTLLVSFSDGSNGQVVLGGQWFDLYVFQ